MYRFTVSLQIIVSPKAILTSTTRFMAFERFAVLELVFAIRIQPSSTHCGSLKLTVHRTGFLAVCRKLDTAIPVSSVFSASRTLPKVEVGARTLRCLLERTVQVL